jgi:SsrA-binding protein
MQTKQKNTNAKLIVKNKRAYYDFHVNDKWEAGIKLLGVEVPALRQGNISLAEGWVKVTSKGAFLVGVTITPLKLQPWQQYDPTRDRQLLLHKQELRKLRSQIQKGFTVIPTKIYFNSRGLAKVEIATAKGKKLHDKRHAIRDRDMKRKGY